MMTEEEILQWKENFRNWLKAGPKENRKSVRVYEVSQACQCSPTVVMQWSSNCRRKMKTKDGVKPGAWYIPSPERREIIKGLMGEGD